MCEETVPTSFWRIEAPRVDYEKPTSDRLGKSSADIRVRVKSARAR